MQKMDFVNNDDAHKISVTRVCALARDDIPFFWSRDNDLGFGNLLLGHLRITSKFSDFDAKNIEALVKVSDHLLHKGFHRGDIDDFEVIQSKFAGSFVTVF